MSQLTRTFIAVDFDNPKVVEYAREVQERLGEAGAVMKRVEPQNLHVTLWFFGELTRNRLDTVLEETGKIRFRPFEVKVRGVGYFPGGSRVNVVWFGIDDPENRLRGLVEELKERLGPKNFKYDERGFTPHLTIARVKYVKNKQRLLSTLRGLRELDIGVQPVTSLKVKKSTLTSRGPIYSDLLVVEARE